MGQKVPEQGVVLLLNALVSKLRWAEPQSISNTLLGVAYMGGQVSAQQLQCMLVALISRPRGIYSQAVGNILWAVADMGQRVPTRHLKPMLAALTRQLTTADPQHISNSLLACVAFRYLPIQLLAALEQQHHLERFLAEACPQALSNTAYAFGQLGHANEAVLTRLLQQALCMLEQDSSGFVSQDLCNLAWAVAVLDMQQHLPAVLQLVQACDDLWAGLSVFPEELKQLHQVHIWLQRLPQHHEGLSAVLSVHQLAECKASWQQQRCSSAAATVSQLQQQVFDSLQQLPSSMWHTAPAMEQVSSDGNFSIDIAAVTAAGVKLAIEVDGPTHFVSPGNWGMKLNGPTQFRNRMLAGQGYTVVSVPYREWQQELKGPEQQQQYLVKRLKGECFGAGLSS